MIAKIENDYPLYKDTGGENFRQLAYDPRTKDGYIATYATDQFVYAIYSGQTMLERQEKKSTNLGGNTLRIFDWEGALVKEYELDVPCSFVCVSDDDKTMWAVATAVDGEVVLVSYDLKDDVEGELNVEKQQSNEVQRAPSTSFAERKPQPPAGAIMFSLDVQTKDGRHNEETPKVLDSMRNLPRGMALNIQPTDRYDVRIDTVDNMITTVLILK